MNGQHGCLVTKIQVSTPASFNFLVALIEKKEKNCLAAAHLEIYLNGAITALHEAFKLNLEKYKTFIIIIKNVVFAFRVVTAK